MTRLIKGLPATNTAFLLIEKGQPKMYHTAVRSYYANEIADFILIKHGIKTIAIGYCREKTEEERAAFKRRYS